MKIGFVLDDSLDKTDGVQQYVVTLGQWMRSRGHQVHYLVGHTERTDLPNIHSLSRNVHTHFNQNRMSTPLPAKKGAIKELLKKEQFDVLHVQLPYSPFMAGKVIKLAPQTTAVIGTFHILPFSKIESLATRILAVLVRSSRKRFDSVVSVSEPAARFAKKRFKVKSSVIPNAVHVQDFKTAKPMKKYRDGKLTILYLGRLVERKGCMYFLRAIEQLHQQNLLHMARIVIAGKGPLQPELEAYVEKHRLKNIVHFVGYVPESEKPSLLASADIAVFPSTGGESFGIVLIEAMAAASAVVIAGDNKGYRSVMAGHKEQIVKPVNTKAFAKMLKHYMHNAAARKRALKWQQSHVSSYDVQVVGSELLTTYREVLLKKTKVQ